jgi:hypothetical protein
MMQPVRLDDVTAALRIRPVFDLIARANRHRPALPVCTLGAPVHDALIAGCARHVGAAHARGRRLGLRFTNKAARDPLVREQALAQWAFVQVLYRTGERALFFATDLSLGAGP